MEAERIDAFWRWWDDHERGLTVLLESNADDIAVRTFFAQVGEQVNELNPELDFRLDRGTGRSRRTLTITAHGQAELMPLARRIRDAAPAPTRRWSYSNFILRVADIHAAFFVDPGPMVRLADALVSVEDVARKVEVGIWHPRFERMGEQDRFILACSMMEPALGEEHLLSWVNAISALDERPDDGVDLWELRRIVDDVRGRFLEVPGHSHWSHLEGVRYDGAPVHARVSVPLSSARAPLLEQVVTIRLRLEDPTGSPHADQLEERIVQAIGFDGELVAVETVGSLRTWYCYVRPETAAMQRLMDLAQAEELSAEAANDPSWDVVSHLS